ncbi:MAG TPA: amidohydrolase, partial [Citreicella sp.]|nr:amidohydrolase [Citreicella sp.]
MTMVAGVIRHHAGSPQPGPEGLARMAAAARQAGPGAQVHAEEIAQALRTHRPGEEEV